VTIKTATQKNNLASAYGTAATHAAVYTTVPGASAGTEPSGGSPAYARKAITWSAPSNGVRTATVVFDIPASVTLNGAGVHSAASGTGNYLDGGAITPWSPGATQGTFTLALTFTEQ